MKTKNGANWYIEDLSCYKTEFLQEIIEDLLEKLETHPDIKKQLEEEI